MLPEPVSAHNLPRQVDRPEDVVIRIAAAAMRGVCPGMVVLFGNRPALTVSGTKLDAAVGVYGGSNCAVAIGKDQLTRG